jgi:hypothetical protein
MASKKKVNLSDYDLTTTLGTGRSQEASLSALYHSHALYRFIRSRAALPEQEVRGVLCYEDLEEGRHYQAETSGPCHI